MTADFFIHIDPLCRAKGARSTHAAAYRAGERIRDRRMSETYDYSDRNDVLYKEIVLPAEWDNCAQVSWARNREALWNEAERACKRCDARVAREVLLFLPLELTPNQRIEVVRGFARELAERYRGAVDVAIHAPRPQADERHNHAHLLMTTREITHEGLGRRTTLEIMGADRRARGLKGDAREEYTWVIWGWAHAVNEAYREAGLTVRVDPRSYKERGIDYEPPPTIPQKILYAERKTGKATPAGDQIRAMYRERVEARLKGGDALARVLQKQKEQERQRKMEYAQRMALVPRKKARSAMTRDERNELRRNKRHANREEFNRRVRERYKKNPATRLAWERANAKKYNARRREARRAAIEKQKRVRATQTPVLEQRAQSVRTPAAAPRESVAAWLEFRKQHPPEASADYSIAAWRAFRAAQPQDKTADDSIAAWRAFRERQGPEVTPQESIAKWREVRERELRAQEARADSNERSRGLGAAGRTDDDDEEDQQRKKIRSRDYGLEL
jgi:hypothetical protein